MAFKIEAFQNRFLAPGQRRIDAILTVTADAGTSAGGGAGGATGAHQMVLGFIVDKSGSMAGDRIEAVKRAVTQAIRLLDETAWFFVVAFDGTAQMVVRETQATPAAKRAAEQAISQLTAGGGTSMSTGLALARSVFARAPDAIREAIFLTDGKNESEPTGTVTAELTRDAGIFECHCWGVGTDWKVGEVQEIARALLGKAQIIPEPDGIVQAFTTAMETANAKALKDVRVRLWTPQGAEVVFFKQVNPTIEEMSNRAKPINAQVREFFTGSWGGAESRDFHVAIDVKGGAPGDEMLGGRPSVVYSEWQNGAWVEREEKPAEARLFASWTADDSLSSRIDRHVAHYSGQDELAQAIQTGLELRERGDEAKATQFLGKAVQIAHASGNVETTQRLSKVVEVLDAATGTVRLKKQVSKAATMDLDLESHTTKRARKS